MNSSPGISRWGAGLAATLADPIDPAELARRLINGIEADVMHILTDASSLATVDDWLARISASVATARRNLGGARRQ